MITPVYILNTLIILGIVVCAVLKGLKIVLE